MLRSLIAGVVAVGLVATSVAYAQAGRLSIRRAFYEQLESASAGLPERMVEVLVRVKTPHSHLALQGVGPLAESLESRRDAVTRACGRVIQGLTSPVPGPAAPSATMVMPLPTLAAPPVVVDSLWAARCIHVRVPASSLSALVCHPEIDGLFENVKIQASPGEKAMRTVSFQGSAPDYWNMARMRVPQARKAFGVDGTGVVVGHIDTGVDGTHPALAGKILRFSDFINGRRDPYDDDGHGTHTAGLICGSGGMGAAPGARLIVAKALNQKGDGSISTLLKAMQWMLDPDGNPRTNDYPAIVNNSWAVNPQQLQSDGIETTLFWEAVRAWRSKGIVPVFAAGNTGANTLLLPGSYPVNFGVAATDASDNVASFSCSGRADWIGWAFFKPDVSAPGVDIPSAYPGGRIAWMTGTSMSAPQVSGILALTVQARANIILRERERLVMDGCVDIGDPGRGQRSGEGRVDAYRVVELARNYRAPAKMTAEYAPVFLRARRFQVKK